MKQIALTALMFALALSLVSASKAYAVDVNLVGNESYTVSWQGLPAGDTGDRYQLLFGQANTGRKDSGLSLESRSRTVTLHNLKPCTTYAWDLYSGKAGRYSKVLSNNMFTTGGVCASPVPATTYGNSMVSNVVEKTQVSGTKSGSSTIGWSSRPNVKEYHVYYRSAADAKYVHAVTVPGTGTSVTINYLQPGVTYYYRVAAVVDGKEQWYPEKQLQTATGEKPVLGVTTQPQYSGVGGSTGYQGILGTTDPTVGRQVGTVCSTDGKANVSIRHPQGVSVEKVHVFFGTGSNNYQHAVRDLSPSAREVTIGHLDTCRNYVFQVLVIGKDGRGFWQGEHVMSASK
jgi:hypothetical protein